MGQKMAMVVLILICGVLLVPSDEAQPPHFRAAHGNQPRPPPKYADSPSPPTTHTPSKGSHLAYGALQPGTPACNAGINGNCGGRRYNVAGRKCALSNNRCRSG